MTKPRHPKPTLEQRAGRALRHAADILEDRGWTQGKLGDPETGFCAVGAIQFAQIGTTAGKVAYITGTDVCNYRLIFTKWLKRPVETWNDRPGTTQEEVIATMRKAADDLDPQTWI